MLTQVSVVPPPGAFWDSLNIPVLAPDPTNGVFVEKVDGLEPVAAEITTNGYNQEDGDFYVGSRVPKRNLVLHLVMERNSNYLSVAEVRRNLYGYFMPKMNILLQLDFDDHSSVQIEGWVESFEGDRWSNDPNAAVSIICPKPNFLDVTPVPISGNSLVGSDPPLTDVLNEGDRMVGFALNIVNNSAVDFFEGDIHIERFIEGSTPGEYFSTQKLWLEGITLPNSSFGSHLVIDTRQGQKSVKIINESSDPPDEISVMGLMTEDSSWPVLWAAMNKFRVVTTGTTGWAGNDLDWSLEFTPQYGGM